MGARGTRQNTDSGTLELVKKIVALKIHPAIGIMRVGNSPDYFWFSSTSCGWGEV